MLMGEMSAFPSWVLRTYTFTIYIAFQPLLFFPFLSFLLDPGCHLYSINTHHGSELRIVAAIRTKLLLITRKHPGFSAVASRADSPVEEFQYIRV